MRPEGEQVRQLPDGREGRAAKQFDGHTIFEGRQVQLDRLGESREVGHHQQYLVLVPQHISEDLAVLRREEFNPPLAQRAPAFTEGQHPPHPPQQGMRVEALRFHVHCFVLVFGVQGDRQIQLLRVRARKPRVAIRAPLHRRSHPVAVAQVDIVPHPDLVAVVKHRRAGQRQQQPIQQIYPLAVVAQQRRQPPPNSQVEPRLVDMRVHPVHVVPLLVRHHLQGQLVVVPQEERPLARRRYRRRLLQDIHNRRAVLHPHGHEQARHERKMIRHVAFVSAALAEIRHRILRPLIRFRQQHPVLILPVHVRAQPLQESMGLRQVLAIGALLLVEVGHRIQPQPVHAQVEPEIHHFEHRLMHFRILIIQVRLVRKEPVPVVGSRHWVPGPVRGFHILENDPRLRVLVGRAAPRVEPSPPALGRRQSRALKPLVLIRGMVQDQFSDDSQAAVMRLPQEDLEILQRAILRMNLAIVGDIIPVVLERRGVKRQQPHRRHPQVLKVVQLVRQARKVPAAIPVGIMKRAHMHLVNDRA